VTLEEALSEVKAKREAKVEAGMDRSALEQSAAQGLANGEFEENVEEMPQLLDEFYPDNGRFEDDTPTQSSNRSTLGNKLKQKNGAHA